MSGQGGNAAPDAANFVARAGLMCDPGLSICIGMWRGL